MSRWQRVRAIYRQPFGKSTLWTLMVARRWRPIRCGGRLHSGDSYASPTADPGTVASLEQDQGGVVLMTTIRATKPATRRVHGRVDR